MELASLCLACQVGNASPRGGVAILCRDERCEDDRWGRLRRPGVLHALGWSRLRRPGSLQLLQIRLGVPQGLVRMLLALACHSERQRRISRGRTPFKPTFHPFPSLILHVG